MKSANFKRNTIELTNKTEEEALEIIKPNYIKVNDNMVNNDVVSENIVGSTMISDTMIGTTGLKVSMMSYTSGKMINFPRKLITTGNEKLLYYCAKRIFDVLFSILGLVLLAPIILLTSIAIKVNSKGKVIFSQLRTGKNGKTFRMYKFRSMYEDSELLRYDLLERNEMDGPVFKIADDPRITKTGKFIRKTSIDEIPQLINIIKGDMSIVGPRPLAVYETDLFSNYENMRHQIKPGLTCYWQISGRNDINFEQWMELDRKYMRDMNIWTDVKIMIRTIRVVLLGKGAY